MGGYVGLLLGFSILQIPDILMHTFDKVKKLYENRLNKQNSEFMDQINVTKTDAEKGSIQDINIQKGKEA